MCGMAQRHFGGVFMSSFLWEPGVLHLFQDNITHQLIPTSPSLPGLVAWHARFSSAVICFMVLGLLQLVQPHPVTLSLELLILPHHLTKEARTPIFLKRLCVCVCVFLWYAWRPNPKDARGIGSLELEWQAGSCESVPEMNSGSQTDSL